MTKELGFNFQQGQRDLCDWLWDLPTLLCNEYRRFIPREKAIGVWS
jgi:hypothetical protein